MQKKYILSLRKESYGRVVQDGLSGSVPSPVFGRDRGFDKCQERVQSWWLDDTSPDS